MKSSPPAKRKCEGDGSLGDFKVVEVLRHDVDIKLMVVLATRIIDGAQAVIVIDKKPMDSHAISQMFTHESVMQVVAENDIYVNADLTVPKDLNKLKVTVICPATQKHIDKYREQESFMVTETAEQYTNVTLPHIEKDQFDPEWVYNILEGKAEAERVIFRDENKDTGFLMAPDLKWDGKTMDNLYVTGIINRRDIRSLRDLTSDHLPLLEAMVEKGSKAISEHYGIDSNKLKVYVHYQPSYYHLHVHFISITNRAPGSSVGHAHLLQDVIAHIKLMSDFYQKIPLTFRIKKTDKLYEKLTKKEQ